MPCGLDLTRMRFSLLALCLFVASPAHAIPILDVPGLTSIVVVIPLASFPSLPVNAAIIFCQCIRPWLCCSACGGRS